MACDNCGNELCESLGTGSANCGKLSQYNSEHINVLIETLCYTDTCDLPKVMQEFIKQESCLNQNVFANICDIWNNIDDLWDYVYELNKRLTQAEKDIDNLENRMDVVENDIDNLENRMDVVEQDITDLDGRVTNNTNHIADNSKRIDQLDNRITNVENHIKITDDAFTKILENLKDKGVWIQTGDTIFEGDFGAGMGVAGGNINLFTDKADSTHWIRTNNGKTEDDIVAGI